jgi:hypothetical protein
MQLHYSWTAGIIARNQDHDVHLPERCLYVLLLLRHLLDAFRHCGHVI